MAGSEGKNGKEPEKSKVGEDKSAKQPQKPKIGAGHLGATLRLGLTELRNAFNPSKESVADTELGLYGTITPGEVQDIRENTVPPQESKMMSELREASKKNVKDAGRDDDGKDQSHGR